MNKYSFLLSAKSVTHSNSSRHHYITLVLLLHTQYTQVESVLQGYCWLSKHSDQEIQEAHGVSPRQRAPLQQNHLCNGPVARPKARAGPAWGSKQEQTTSWNYRSRDDIQEISKLFFEKHGCPVRSLQTSMLSLQIKRLFVQLQNALCSASQCQTHEHTPLFQSQHDAKSVPQWAKPAHAVYDFQDSWSPSTIQQHCRLTEQHSHLRHHLELPLRQQPCTNIPRVHCNPPKHDGSYQPCKMHKHGSRQCKSPPLTWEL